MSDLHWTNRRNLGGWRSIPMRKMDRAGTVFQTHPIRSEAEQRFVAHDAVKQGAHWLGTSPQERYTNQHMLCWLGFAYAIVYGDKDSSLSRIHFELSGAAAGDERRGRYRKVRP